MTLTLLDNLFVLLVMILAFPVLGWWSYRELKRREPIEGERALLREYRLTLVMLAGLLIATMLVWRGQARDLSGLFVPPFDGIPAFVAFAAVFGLLLSLIVRPVLALRGGKTADAMATMFAELAPFLPKSRKALRWAILVSLMAGLAEEVVYRGYLLTYFADRLPWWAAIGASAIIFGLAHLYQGFGGMIGTAILGAVFAVIFVGTGSLLIPILLHAAIDVSSMLTAFILLRNIEAQSA